jgi:hypothetical protein
MDIRPGTVWSGSPPDGVFPTAILSLMPYAHLEGSRFGTCRKDHTALVTVLAEPQTWLNKRLPRTLRRVIRRLVPLTAKRSPRKIVGETARAVIRGSRLFKTISSLYRFGKKMVIRPGTVGSGSPAMGIVKLPRV